MSSPRQAQASNEILPRETILIVDDHPVLRQGLVRMIEQEPDLQVCGEAATADEAMALVNQLKPALAIVDLSMEGKPGLELVKNIRADFPMTRVLVLSMHEEALWAERVMRAGACGYVMKQETPRELIRKIRMALKGETCLSDAMADAMLRKFTGRRAAAAAATQEEGLGDREMVVLQMIGLGTSTRDIAAALHISVKTVEAHREHIKRKLNINTSAELIRYAALRFSSNGPANPS